MGEHHRERGLVHDAAGDGICGVVGGTRVAGRGVAFARGGSRELGLVGVRNGVSRSTRLGGHLDPEE